MEGIVRKLGRADPAREEAQHIRASHRGHVYLALDLGDLVVEVRSGEVVAARQRDHRYPDVLCQGHHSRDLFVGRFVGQMLGRVGTDVDFYQINAERLRGGEVFRQRHLPETPCSAREPGCVHLTAPPVTAMVIVLR